MQRRYLTTSLWVIRNGGKTVRKGCSQSGKVNVHLPGDWVTRGGRERLRSFVNGKTKEKAGRRAKLVKECAQAVEVTGGGKGDRARHLDRKTEFQPWSQKKQLGGEG